MNNIEKLRKAAQDFLDATSDTVEQAVTEPAIDHNAPEGWVTDDSERFYFQTNGGEVYSTTDKNYKESLWFLGNLYKTEQEAKEALELLKLDAEIKRFVVFHDKDTPLDWSDEEQENYYFFWYYSENRLFCSSIKQTKRQGTLYMTEQTKDKVLEHFTPEQLERWVKS